MDKVLAFSILSASPADISAGAGLGGSWAARLSWRRGADGDAEQPAAAARRQEQQQREEQQGDKEKRASSSRDGRGRAAAAAPRFAPEFDGIDCFETIVSH